MKKILLLLPFFLLFSCSYLDQLDKEIQKLVHHEKSELEPLEDFVQGSEDIPLLVGMEKISDGTLGFDSASGSIITSSYSTNIEQKKIKTFYLQTLPQMGWNITRNAENSINFKREKENLEIEFAKEERAQVVRFFVSSLTQ
jgi:imidazoleglycerol phosphate synthase glutamine amidotransferase subunit HisH